VSTIEQGTVEVDGQLVAYELREVDTRSANQRQADAAAGRLAGDPAVVIPGHGQTLASPRKLTEAAASLSPGGVAWCIDITMPAGGDPVKARALSAIVRGRISGMFPTRAGPHPQSAPGHRALLIGWSHGGGEALLSAEHDPALFPRVAGLCPTGLIERRPTELVRSFEREVMHIVWTAWVKGDWAGLRGGLRVGFDIPRGMWRDLTRSRSLQAVLDDIRWAAHKVPGPSFAYGGNVALLFARDDTVIRWQAVFPGCAGPQEIPAHLDAYRQVEFPNTARLEVAVLEGNHLSPENAAVEYARTAFALLQPLPPSTRRG
jgi:hypothetical protein